MKKLFLMMMVMVMGGAMFAGNPYIQKSVEAYENYINKTPSVAIKTNMAMALACFQDKTLTANFETFKAKFIELSKKYGYTFQNQKDENLAAVIFHLNLRNLMNDMVVYANGTNKFVNFYYYSHKRIAINSKEELIKVLDRQLSADYKDNYSLSKAFYTTISEYQNILTTEETVKYLKAFKRNIYVNISKSEDWKQLVVKVELMIKANE